jgi:hypothetical protein
MQVLGPVGEYIPREKHLPDNYPVPGKSCCVVMHEQALADRRGSLKTGKVVGASLETQGGEAGCNRAGRDEHRPVSAGSCPGHLVNGPVKACVIDSPGVPGQAR